MDEQKWSYIEAERLSLADLLAGLTPEQWETQSLCSEWRVRDVAAHVAMTPREPSLPTILKGVVRARGDIWGMARDVARQHAVRPTDEIVAELRRDAASRSYPRVTSAENILLDVVVHGQDIAVPLGIPRPVPEPVGLAAFERAWGMGWPFHARKRLRGLRLVATDADLDVGEGPVVEGPLGVLLLLVTARTAAAVERLAGDGVERIPA